MRVAMCIGALEGGGMGTVIDSLAGELKKEGISLEIITARVLVRPPSGIKVHVVRKRDVMKTKKLLEKYDLIHVNGGSLLTLPASLAKKPKMFTFHGQTPPQMHGSRVKNAKAFAVELLYKATIRKFDLIASTSRFGQEDLRRRYGVSRSIWIPNGVDRKTFRPTSGRQIDAIRKKYGHPIMLGVGSPYPVKGWDFMLDCFEEFLEKEGKGTLLIIGSGDRAYEEGLRSRASKGMLAGHVYLLGKKGKLELNDFYNACDLYVSGSPYEGFCLPAVEALACGKPVCLRKKGAMVEHALNSGCGTVFETKREFAARAKEALKMGKKGISRRARDYLKPFNWKLIAKQYAKLYRELSGNAERITGGANRRP